jgi:hypothetical protein
LKRWILNRNWISDRTQNLHGFRPFYQKAFDWFFFDRIRFDRSDRLIENRLTKKYISLKVHLTEKFKRLKVQLTKLTLLSLVALWRWLKIKSFHMYFKKKKKKKFQAWFEGNIEEKMSKLFWNFWVSKFSWHEKAQYCTIMFFFYNKL